jgi:hypothetical protein
VSRALLAVAAVALVPAVAACGGEGDDASAEIEETIVASVTTDDPADCLRLYTTRFWERRSGQLGQAGIRFCEQQVLDQSGAEDPKAVTVADVEVRGQTARADAGFSGSSLDGQTVEMGLVREEEGWKVDELIGFVGLDREKLIDRLSAEMHDGSGGALRPRLARCLTEQFESLDDGDLEALTLNLDTALLRRLLTTCARGPKATESL